MKPTGQAIAYVKLKNDQCNGMLSTGEKLAIQFAYTAGFNEAISQMHPEWVTVNSPADLPKDNKGYWVENHKGEVIPRDGFTMLERNTRRYTPVVKPQPPKD